MPWVLGVGAVAAPIIGGIIGAQQSSDARAAAQAAAQNAVNQITQLGAGPDLAAQIYIQEFQKAGVLTPQMEQQINQNSSQLANVQGNQQAQQAQLQALQAIGQRAQVGLSPTDIANLAQIQQQTAAQAEGQRQAILQQFAARGQGGSGAELLADLSASQAGTQNASNQGLQVASQASQNALAALGQQGQLGSQIENQQFGEASTRANAADQMNRFNIQNQLGIQQANVQAQNAAQAGNLANAQALSNANVSQANAERQRQVQAQQQMYQNLFNRQVAAANAYNGQASNLNQQANQTAGQWTTGATGVSQGIGAIANAYAAGSKKTDPTTDDTDDTDDGTTPTTTTPTTDESAPSDTEQSPAVFSDRIY